MTERTVEYQALDDVIPADRNPKDHDEQLIGASIGRFGFVEPPVVDERTGKLVGGHGRVDELRRRRDAGQDPPEGVRVDGAGVWLIPVMRGWSSASDDEAYAAGIALNRIGERGGWVRDELYDMLDGLSRTDDGLLGLGYDQADMDLMLAEAERAKMEPVPPADPTAPEVAPIRVPDRGTERTQRGDVWRLGDHRIMCGDARDADDVATLLAGDRVNLGFTSPPYADRRTYDETSGFTPIPPDEYVEWFAPIAANVAAHLADDGSWFVNIKPSADGLDTELYVFDLVLAHVREWGWHFATEFTWQRVGVPKNVTRRFKNQFEPVYQFARAEWKMRPDAVRHPSENVPRNLAPGDSLYGHPEGWQGRPAGDASVTMSKVQGEPHGPNVGKRPRVGDTSWKGRQGQRGVNIFGSSPETIKERANGVRGGDAEEVQGTNWAPGEYIGPGLAYPGNLLPTFSGSHEATGHTAAYPVGLPAWFIRAYTDVGDVVYDPFAGSGSTILAAHGEGRRGRGMEISQGYTDVICQRWQRSTGALPILERTGDPVDFHAEP